MLAQSLLSGHDPGSSLFITSAIVGFAAAFPLGPISILTIQRAMTLGFWRAFWPSMGAITADGGVGAQGAVSQISSVFANAFRPATA